MISIDRREKPNKRDKTELASLIRRFGVRAEIIELPYGDFAFQGRDDHGEIYVGIERKRLTDLSMSIDDSRLAGHQKVGMMQSGLYQESWLVVEGVWRPHDPGGYVMEGDNKGNWWEFKPGGSRVLYSKLSRYLMSIQRSGMMTVRTRDMVHTAWEVVDMYHYYQKKAHTSQREKHKLNIASLNGRPPLVRRWAEELDGVGLVKGEAAAALFKTPIALATSEEVEWLGIPGIGVPTAKSIVAQIEGKKR